MVPDSFDRLTDVAGGFESIVVVVAVVVGVAVAAVVVAVARSVSLFRPPFRVVSSLL